MGDALLRWSSIGMKPLGRRGRCKIDIHHTQGEEEEVAAVRN
jgi:hypothetical protein